jgi:FMN phosphatase YigB (HAD superfamily)
MSGHFKLIVVDFYGVLGQLDHDSALELLRKHAPNLRIPGAVLLENYFDTNPYYKDLDLGRMSYRVMLEKVLPELWAGPPDEWFQVWEDIWRCYIFNYPLIQLLQRAWRSGVRVAVASDTHLEFDSWFRSYRLFDFLHDHLYTSSKLGVKKPALEFYQAILEKYCVSPSDALYIDDSDDNIQQSRTFGITSLRFDKYISPDLREQIGLCCEL